MGKLSLNLAFFASGINFLALKMGEVFHVETPLLCVVVLYLPAAILGSKSWWMVRSFGRSWPVLLCTAIAWIGLLYAFEIEKHRGIVAVSYLTLALPIAALIVEKRYWWQCAKVYVLANSLALAVAFWFEYWDHGITMLRSLHRFGFLMSDDGTRKLANPNLVGGQLAFAAVLAFLLYLRYRARGTKHRNASRRSRGFSLGWTVFLSLGCVLTASRGAFAAWLGGMGVLLFWETRTQRPSKLRDLVAVSAVLLFAFLFAAAATGLKPWETLRSRLDASEQVVTAGGRVMIWREAFHAWHSSLQYLLVGTGTGVAPEALGRYLKLVELDGITPTGVDCHNAFVEWGLSFGLVGMAAGTCLLAALWYKALRLDHRDRVVSRQAILLSFCLASMTYVTFYRLFFVAAGALILSGLSEPPSTAPAAPSMHPELSRCSSPTTLHARTARGSRPKGVSAGP